MIPYWLGMRIGSRGKKGFPFLIPLFLVYLLLLMVLVPVLLVTLVMFIAGRGKKGKTVLSVLFGSLRLITSAKGFSLEVDSGDDRVRFFIR